MQMKQYLLIPSFLLLTGCVTDGLNLNIGTLTKPQGWTAEHSAMTMLSETEKLKEWWKRFDDPTLNALVETALQDSPDRRLAEARILEARGLRRTSRSALFPQLNLTGDRGRQDTGKGDGGTLDGFYDAGFDASFEVDVFGKNRRSFSAADQQLLALEAEYHDVTLSLIAELVRSYIDFRTAQNQHRIAHKNLSSQEQTLELINNLFELGSAPRLDVERASALVNTTRASLPEFKRQEENARLQLSVLAGQLPEELLNTLSTQENIPNAIMADALMSPAQVLELRPDIRAAKANLLARTDLTDAAIAELFPTFTMRGFYGITDSALVSSATVWNIALGMAVNLLDFGKIEGRIDAAKAREKQAFETYRKTVLEAVVEVETALNDYARITEKRISLESAYQSSEKALELSQALYKEGEISFLDVLDAQRNVNDAEATTVQARADQAESMARLFKSLGIY